MSEIITVRGFVATDTKLKKLDSDTDTTDFRLACTERWFDREKNQWVEGQTNWFSVSAYRDLARNVVASLKKGDKVIVMGRLKIRSYTRQDSSIGTYVGLDAVTIGHDLTWATSTVLHKTYQGRANAEGNTAEANATETNTSATNAIDVNSAEANSIDSNTVDTSTGELTSAPDQALDRDNVSVDDDHEDSSESHREPAFA
ncbi:single-stranded DNA-binding protein [Neomicrococcus aestuarii]|uniref:Single-stranded DNA-binding protein n=1 Tax=Neomicrococcus aestuarii TaxID=556325 RepID=A0A1L2ZLU5_9MICC|nr:single-stranded DNA-binding protein [Neomicrococcus aestuarii]APF39988.1 hypothetical protein BHE16_01965 [Neomicrococcus aestuarii]